MDNNFCCGMMNDNIVKCNEHDDPFEGVQNLIWYEEKFDEYGLIVFDGGQSYVIIDYCPWYGKKLPESKRNIWFEMLENEGCDQPLEQNIPEIYKTAKWYKSIK